MSDGIQTSERPKGINWRNALFMTLTPLASAILVPFYIYKNGLSWGLVAFFAVCYAISNMSITCGYHRYFSHRSYDVHPFVEFLYVFFGAGAFQGSILQWCTDHRRHHRMVDSNDDPYSIKKGFWYAHIGWLFEREDPRFAGNYAVDLSKKKLVQFQHDHYALVATFVGFVLPMLVGWAFGFPFGGLIFGGVFRIVCSEHSTFFINSLCHTIGRQPYNDRHSARDSFVMAVLTFGEGYHNFHHQFQADYRNGIRWYQWDPTKWWIQILKIAGLATRLKQVSKDEILKARLAMDERIMLARGANADRVIALKARITDAQARMRHLREDYLRVKESLRARARTARRSAEVAAAAAAVPEILSAAAHVEPVKLVAHIRAERRRAKRDFRDARKQWQAYARRLRAEAA